jgi:glucan 1,3-beta-glucosidase
VRTYSTRNGLDRVPEIAARHGVKVMLGLWLGGEAELNRRDVAAAIALANRYRDTVRSVVVGNEVLLRGEMSGSDLAATIRHVKSAVPVPVTYADVWEFWLRHRDVYDAVDFVTIHILPYWEDFPIPAAQAAEHVSSIRQRMVAAFPAKEVFLGEMGWPSAGRMREGALPSPSNQALVMHEVLARAKKENFHVNLIEAFDQPWKRQLEGTVGGHWGLLDGSSRRMKFAWGEPVSNHPYWMVQAALGVALAALVFLAGGFFRQPGMAGEQPLRRWCGVAAIALASGSLIGWTLENVPIESLGAGGWIRSLALAALALFVPPLAAAALAREQPLLSLARSLDLKTPPAQVERITGLLFAALVVVAVQVALGLVFDPRYRDFAFAPLTGAAVPFVVLSFVGGRAAGEVGVAEKAFALVLVLAALYVVPNEGLANWQALWFGAVLTALAVVLLRLRDAPD